MQLNPTYDPLRTLEFIRTCSGIKFDSLTPIDQVDPDFPPFPKSWIPLIGMNSKSTLDFLWGKARLHLPTFCKLLEQRLLGLYFATGIYGPVLVYFLEEWNFNHKLDGTMVAGPPATLQQIERVQQELGPLPPAIPALWQSHSFIELRASGTIFSLGLNSPYPQSDLAGLGPKHSEDKSGPALECLEVASCNKDEAYALTRMPGQSHWKDKIVDAHRTEGIYYPSIYENLDQLFIGYLDEVII